MDIKYCHSRVTFDGKYWDLSVGVERAFEPVPLTDEVIGVDVGIKHLAVCSNGMIFPNINKTKTMKRLEKRLRRLRRKVSRKYEMNKEGSRFVKTRNMIKLERRCLLWQRRINGIRNNHIHQATSAIAKTKPCSVVMETLNVSGMMKNKHLAKAVQEQKLHGFKAKSTYKCKKYGMLFIEADAWYPSSKLCSQCGAIKKGLTVSDRTYTCQCGCKLDRDLNASINLARYGEAFVG